MAKALEIKTIAEGVETEEQLKLLKSRGCGLIQGYLIGMLMSKNNLYEMLNGIK